MSDAKIFEIIENQSTSRLMRFRPKYAILQYMLRTVLRERNMWNQYKDVHNV